MRLRKYSSRIKEWFLHIDIKFFDFIIFLIPILSFGYVLFVYFPGCLTFDSYNQLTQISTLEFTAGHPLFHTLLELVLLKIWNNPAIIAIFQILSFSSIWAFICKYNRKNVQDIKLKIIQILITLAICLIPINSIDSITLWKDILYSYSILLLSFILQIWVDKKFLLNNKQIFLTAILITLVPNLRHNGLIILLMIGVILSIILFIKDRASNNWIKFIIALILLFNVFKIPGEFLLEDSLSLPSFFSRKILHVTADYLHKDLFDEDEKSFINTFVKAEDLMSVYNPYFTDPLGSIEINYSEYFNSERALIKLLAEKTVENPRVFLNYVADSTVILWQMKLPGNMTGTIITTGYDAVNNVDNIQQINAKKPVFENYNTYITNTLENKYTKTIFYNPAFFLYISIVCTIAVIFLKKWKWSYLLILSPNIANLIGLSISIPIQDARYVYASLLVAYLTFIILSYEIFTKIFRKETNS